MLVSSEPTLHFATANLDKFREARRLLGSQGLQVVRIDAKLTELQHDDLGQIALYALHAVPRGTPRPYFVEDSGLFVFALGGFPGPYSAYAYRTVGCAGVLRLLGRATNRSAVFRAAVAVQPEHGAARLFRGASHGTITRMARGSGGFGFDPIFVPTGETRTFGELPVTRKNRLSHRARALRQLAHWVAAPTLAC